MPCDERGSGIQPVRKTRFDFLFRPHTTHCPQCGSSLGFNKAAEEATPARALTEDREQQFRPGLGEGYEAQFIDDQQFQAGQPLCGWEGL